MSSYIATPGLVLIGYIGSCLMFQKVCDLSISFVFIDQYRTNLGEKYSDFTVSTLIITQKYPHHICAPCKLLIKDKLESTARYAGLPLAPAKGFGLQHRLVWPFRQKNSV